MSHELDMSNGRANMAFVGEKPWHGLGAELTPGASIKTWTKEAGLDFTVLRAPASYQPVAKGDGPLPDRREVSNRHVLYRDDTHNPLGMVSDRYNIVQPREVMDFFSKLADIGGFEMETAGSLFGGQKIWAMAKVGAGAMIADKDAVRPYIMLATSFDGTMATKGMFTATRVVCNNTIRMALQGETEKTSINIPHISQFDAELLKDQLGIGVSLWDQWVARSRKMAKVKLSGQQADELLVRVIGKTPVDETVGEDDLMDIRDSRAYKSIMRLFEGDAIGSELAGHRTAWQMLNATTEYVDHHMSKAAESRMRSAWFGNGADLKSRMQDALLAV